MQNRVHILIVKNKKLWEIKEKNNENKWKKLKQISCVSKYF